MRIKRTTKLIIIGTCLLTMFMGLTGWLFVEAIHEKLLSYAEDEQLAVASHVAAAVSNKFSYMLEVLKAVEALHISKNVDDDNASLRKLLREESERRGIIRLGIAYKDGNAITGDNKPLYIGDRDYFKKAMQGVPNTSQRLVDRVGSGDIVVQAVPLRKNDAIIGVLFSTENIKNIADIMNDIIFHDINDSLAIVDRSGYVISSSTDSDFHEGSNILELLENHSGEESLNKIKTMLYKGMSGVAGYRYAGMPYIIACTPINYTVDWRVVVSINEDIAMSAASEVINWVIALIVILIPTAIGSAMYMVIIRDKFMREQELSRSAIYSAGIHLLRLSGEGQLMDCDDAFAMRFGIHTQRGFYHMEDFACDKEWKFPKNIKAGDTFEFCCTADKPVYMNFHVIRDSDSPGEMELMGLDVTEQKIKDLKIKNLAYTDQLTGLPNRARIMETIDSKLGECKEADTMGAVCYVNLNNYRMVNSIFGYRVGDMALVSIAEKLKTFVSPQIILGRLGGDIFAFVLSGHKKSEVHDFVDRLSKVFDTPVQVEGSAFHITCRIGVVIYGENCAMREMDTDKVIRNCEAAAMTNFARNKTSVSYFDNALDMEIEQDIRMEYLLKNSIKNDELSLHYQPQYNSHSGRIEGFEALIRWQNDELGSVPPQKFIQVAERSGFIQEIGEFVVDRTFSFAKSLEPWGVCVSFNASAVDLMQVDYVDYVMERFRHYSLARESVALEITESCLLEAFEDVAKKLSLMQENGIKVYLDDFGTGYSSLSYLSGLPVNVLKIDKSFVDGMLESHAQEVIASSIISMSMALDINVIAEGVESKEQMDLLASKGCFNIQGYYISRPVPQEQVLPLLQRYNG